MTLLHLALQRLGISNELLDRSIFNIPLNLVKLSFYPSFSLAKFYQLFVVLSKNSLFQLPFACNNEKIEPQGLVDARSSLRARNALRPLCQDSILISDPSPAAG